MNVLVCMQHKLTDEQLKELNDLGFNNIHQLKDVDNELFNQVANCPVDETELTKLAKQLERVVKDFDAIVLPIGSPAFNFVFNRLLSNIRVLFAHSERVATGTTQPDGTVTKNVLFKHIRFINFHI